MINSSVNCTLLQRAQWISMVHEPSPKNGLFFVTLICRGLFRLRTTLTASVSIIPVLLIVSFASTFRLFLFGSIQFAILAIFCFRTICYPIHLHIHTSEIYCSPEHVPQRLFFVIFVNFNWFLSHSVFCLWAIELHLLQNTCAVEQYCRILLHVFSIIFAAMAILRQTEI